MRLNSAIIRSEIGRTALLALVAFLCFYLMAAVQLLIETVPYGTGKVFDLGFAILPPVLIDNAWVADLFGLFLCFFCHKTVNSLLVERWLCRVCSCLCPRTIWATLLVQVLGRVRRFNLFFA